MDLNFVLIVILAAWVGICEYRIYRLEKKLEKGAKNE
ncbi:hypothetical protein HRAG_02447 [Helicobacter bilis ATCC 43879]|uniref:Uncharacterized protein n=1 Tax=Helicobacter bilis ATCC 43879 TaxID=613026 RepID=T5LSL7_9HELI|nr:hypothetical protein HRAG_02447 [Helicobacter bilis ATCC 43879]